MYKKIINYLIRESYSKLERKVLPYNNIVTRITVEQICSPTLGCVGKLAIVSEFVSGVFKNQDLAGKIRKFSNLACKIMNFPNLSCNILKF